MITDSYYRNFSEFIFNNLSQSQKRGKKNMRMHEFDVNNKLTLASSSSSLINAIDCLLFSFINKMLMRQIASFCTPHMYILCAPIIENTCRILARAF